MSKKVLVSACLLGRPVRYDGRSRAVDNEILSRWLDADLVIGVCPEVDAGLSVPRVAAEIVGGVGVDVLQGTAEVITSTGENVTQAFLHGANIALSLCREHGASVAVMTENSPSCASSEVYDGSFSKTKTPGFGVTVSLLRQHGIEVFNQHQLPEADRVLGCPGK